MTDYTDCKCFMKSAAVNYIYINENDNSLWVEWRSSIGTLYGYRSAKSGVGTMLSAIWSVYVNGGSAGKTFHSLVNAGFLERDSSIDATAVNLNEVGVKDEGAPEFYYTDYFVAADSSAIDKVVLDKENDIIWIAWNHSPDSLYAYRVSKPFWTLYVFNQLRDAYSVGSRFHELLKAKAIVSDALVGEWDEFEPYSSDATNEDSPEDEAVEPAEETDTLYNIKIDVRYSEAGAFKRHGLYFDGVTLDFASKVVADAMDIHGNNNSTYTLSNVSIDISEA